MKTLCLALALCSTALHAQKCQWNGKQTEDSPLTEGKKFPMTCTDPSWANKLVHVKGNLYIWPRNGNISWAVAHLIFDAEQKDATDHPKSYGPGEIKIPVDEFVQADAQGSATVSLYYDHVTCPDCGDKRLWLSERSLLTWEIAPPRQPSTSTPAPTQPTSGSGEEKFPHNRGPQ